MEQNPDSTLRVFGAALRALREANDWEQATLGTFLGQTERGIRRWENGEFPPRRPARLRSDLERLRHAGKLPRGDLDAVLEALTAVELARERKKKGPVNRQKTEEKPNHSQGSSSSKTGQGLQLPVNLILSLWRQHSEDHQNPDVGFFWPEDFDPLEPALDSLTEPDRHTIKKMSLQERQLAAYRVIKNEECAVVAADLAAEGPPWWQ